VDNQLEKAPARDIITPRQSEIMLRWLEGQSIEAIATRYHVTVEKVRAVLRLRAVKNEIQRLSQLTRDELIRDRVGGLASEALDTLRDTMRGENTSELKFKAAKELLDKTPVLKQAGDLGKGIGEGIGEAIINRLAELDGAARAQAAIDVTPATLRPEADTAEGKSEEDA
jgi:DNA-binding CsgD family transcriptional regulator